LQAMTAGGAARRHRAARNAASYSGSCFDAPPDPHSVAYVITKVREER